MSTFTFIIFGDLINNDPGEWANIGYLAASLKEVKDINVSVNFYDISNLDMAINDAIKLTPDFIGVPILQYNLEISLKFIRDVKIHLINSCIITGNITASIFSTELMTDYPEIDYTIIGEGEKTIVELCDCLLNNRCIDDCQGIAYRRDGIVHKTKFREPIKDLDILPFPDRSYSNNSFGKYSIIGSRGCDGHCTFCDANTLYRYTNCSLGVRYRSIENIIDEIEYLIKNWNAKSIYFSDSTFGDEKRLKEFYDSMVDKKIKIPMKINLRCDMLSSEMCHILDKLTEVGLFHIILGVESGNDDDLRLYSKISNIKINKIALSNLKYLYTTPIPRIHLGIGFINFNPYSTINKLKDNIDFLKENKVLDFRTVASKLIVTPSQSLAIKLKRDNLLTEELNYQFTNGYAYNFAFDNINKLYNVVNYLSNTIDTTIYDRMYYLYNYIRLHRDVNGLEKGMVLLNEYNDYVGELVYKSFNKIIDMLDKEEIAIKDIMDKELSNDKKILKNFENELDKYGHKLGKLYFSIS